MPERAIGVNKRDGARAKVVSATGQGEHPLTMQQLWNDPKDTVPLASFAKKVRREISNERRDDDHRAAVGVRRVSLARTLRALFKL